MVIIMLTALLVWAAMIATASPRSRQHSTTTASVKEERTEDEDADDEEKNSSKSTLEELQKLSFSEYLRQVALEGAKVRNLRWWQHLHAPVDTDSDSESDYGTYTPPSVPSVSLDRSSSDTDSSSTPSQ